MVKVMNNKRNYLKVLSALFAFCNLFSLVNTSAARKANVVSQNMEVKHSLPGNGFKILEFHNGIRLVYTLNVDYNVYKDKIFNAIKEIKRDEKCKTFLCFSLGRNNPVVIGIKDYVNIFFIKPQILLGSNIENELDTERKDDLLTKFVFNSLKGIVSGAHDTLVNYEPSLKSFTEKPVLLTVKYIESDKHNGDLVKKSFDFLKYEKQNRKTIRKKDVATGNFHLVYVKDCQDGTRLFKTDHNGQSVRVKLDKKGEVIVIYDKLGLGVSLSLEGKNYLYYPDLDFKTREYIRKSVFLDTYRSRTGKEFDYSLVDDISNYLDSKFYGYSKTKDVDIGKFHLEYKETSKDGGKVFTVNNNGENIMLKIKEDNGSLFLCNEHGLGLSISPDSVVYFAIINRDKKNLSKEKFNSIWYEKTGKEFDHSLVDDISNYLDSKLRVPKAPKPSLLIGDKNLKNKSVARSKFKGKKDRNAFIKEESKQ